MNKPIEPEIKNEPYTIQEALKAIEGLLPQALRITATKEEKMSIFKELLVLTDITQKWVIEHLISL